MALHHCALEVTPEFREEIADRQLLGEYDKTGKALREYVWLDNIPVAMFMPDPANASTRAEITTPPS